MLGVPTDYVKACSLVVISETPTHGYELAEQLSRFGIPHSSGALYRRLRAMENAGLLRSCWEPSDSGPARRTYHVTRSGRQWLDRWIVGVARDHQGVCRCLASYDQLARNRPAAPLAAPGRRSA